MFRNVLIAGLGLIGGSIAMALHALPEPPEVVGYDADPETLEQAAADGIVATGVMAGEGRLAETLRSRAFDLVVLATPIRYAPEMLQEIEESGYAGIITDTASTKASICRIAEHVLSDTSRFIPGHPMAGSEVNGLKGANKGMFTGKYWILCPDGSTDTEGFARLHALVTSLGAKCISVDRDEHDDMIAIVSHVPHMTASALVTLALRHAHGRDELFRLAAGGFKDSTRIAAGSPTLWTDIVMDNRDVIAAGLAEYRAILGELEQAIASGDAEQLGAFLARSASARRKVPKVWLPNSERLTLLSVPMENHAGAVATVTALAGRCGCNIQSLNIDHITESTAMLEMVLTDEGDIEALVAALEEEGFEATLVAVTDEPK